MIKPSSGCVQELKAKFATVITDYPLRQLEFYRGVDVCVLRYDSES
jgi:hypothetical protein